MPSRPCIAALETMTATPAHAYRVSEKPTATRTGFRFGVAFRLLIAFAAITAFAVAVSAVALFTFGEYERGFTRIASSNLPALIAASDLAQRSQALAANAPNLAVGAGNSRARKSRSQRSVAQGKSGEVGWTGRRQARIRSCGDKFHAEAWHAVQPRARGWHR